jgi:exonuclease SbcC
VKLHRLQIQNLNSLYGKHTIDFEGELSGANLYLIAGPTGSGKSTILDAVSLALFGQTARLKGTWSDEENDGTINIMSRGTGECRADLEFSLRDQQGRRKRYRAIWKMRRAHEKPDGSPQKPTRTLIEIQDASDNKELVNSDRSKDIDPVFDDALCGLTMDDFLKRIILAQGEFSGFVRSDEKTRRDILEKLVPTDRFRAFGEVVANEHRQRKKEVEKLELQLEAAYDEEKEAEETAEQRMKRLKAESKSVTKERDKKRTELNALDKKLSWLKTLKEHRAKLAEAGERSKKAEQAWEQLTDDRERLERHKATEPFTELLWKKDNMESDQRDVAANIEEYSNEVTKLAETVESHEVTVEAKSAAAAKARKTLEDAKPKLEKAAKAWEDVRSIRQRHESALKQLKEVQEREAKQAKTVDSAKSSVQSAADELESTNEKLSALPFVPSLLDHSDELETQRRHLEEKLTAVRQAKEQLEEKVEYDKDAKQAVHDATEKAEHAKEQAREKAEALETIQKEMEATLKKANAKNAEELRNARDSAQKQREGFDDLVALREAAAAREEELSKAKKVSEQANKALTKAASATKEQRAKLDEAKAQCSDLETLVAGEEARWRLADQLKPEQPCPLCGSEEHSHDPSEVRARIEASLERAQAQLEEARQSRDSASKKLAELEDIEKNASKNTTKADSAYEAAEREFHKAVNTLHERAQELNVELRYSDSDEQWSKEQAALATNAQTLDELVQTTRNLQKSRQDASKAVELADSERKQAESLQKEAEKRAKKEEKRLKAAKEELKDKQTACSNLSKKLATFLNNHGWHEFDEQDSNINSAALERIYKQHARGKELTTQTSQLQTRLEERKKTLEDTTKQLEETKEERKEQAKAVEDAEEDVAKALAKAQEFFDGQKPQTVREQLDEAIQQKSNALEEAKSRLQKLKTKLAEKQTALKTAREQRDKLAQSLKKTRASLSEQLEKSDFESLADVTSAQLDKDTREQLSKAIDEAADERKLANENLKTCQKDLDDHLNNQPDDSKPEAEKLEEQLDAFTQEKTQLEETIEELNAQRGRLETKRESLQQQMEKQRELAEQFEAARKELDRWSELHELVGQNDGKNFVLWVLALTFNQLLRYANRHLEKLNPRYRLRQRVEETGERKLDFHVIDRDAADTERPTATLSGGETFLVSLALALGLSELDSVDFRSETLLLDEGFGTLDAESLEDALRTLEELHATNNVQVGIISHVESLQQGDRIPAQIRVQKIGDGRSKLEIHA